MGASINAESVTGCTSPAGDAGASSDRQHLRLLSFNIQTGIATSRYRHYLTRSLRHVLPHPERLDNLDRIAGLLGHYDIVGLQEVDGGSLRSGFINQTEYLAMQAGFPHWHVQTNRNLGKFAQHSIGVVSRLRPSLVKELRLPGMIPGRGALMLRFGRGEQALHVLIMHLALSRRARLQQFAYVAEQVCDCRHVILMGDFNCGSDSVEMNWLLDRTRLREPQHGLHTFPSWRPERNIDHILVSPTLTVSRTRVLPHPISDHLPIEMEVALPPEVALDRQTEPTSSALMAPLRQAAV
jgi:endonuclease/exonuclease/phosphatase family metal-dependent hydrolase